VPAAADCGEHREAAEVFAKQTLNDAKNKFTSRVIYLLLANSHIIIQIVQFIRAVMPWQRRPALLIRIAADDFIKYIVTPCQALEEFDYEEPVRADQLREPGRITSQVIKHLINDDLVVADLTTNNANVYYELSLRHALGKAAIHMALVDTPVSFDIRDNRTIFYTMHSRTAEAAREELASQIRHVHQKGYKATNPIIETAGIVKLEHSADPDQKGIGQLMRMVESLGGEIASLRATLREVQLRQTANTNALAVAATSPGLWNSSGGIGGLGSHNLGFSAGTGILSDHLTRPLAQDPNTQPNTKTEIHKRST
jgi:hypothetical protein